MQKLITRAWLLAAALIPAAARAQGAIGTDEETATGGIYGLEDTAKEAGLPHTQGDLLLVVAQWINYALGLIGIVFFILTLYAGFLWLTAREDAGQVKKAKDILRNAVIGLVIIFSSYAVVNFIFTKIQ